jgi:putative PIN family toxin of toxin-antitoxin system
MKIILDNNIYISSIVFDSQMEDFVNHIYGILNYNFYFSTETFVELENTLNSSKFAKLLAKSTRQLTLETRLEYLEQIKSNSIFKGEIKTKVDICRDPKDNKF